MSTFLEQVAIDAQNTFYGGEFAEQVTIYTPSQSVTVSAIVDMTHTEYSTDLDSTIMTRKPRISLWAPSVPFRLMADQKVILRGKTYVVRDVEQQGDQNEAQDGDGSVILHLNPAERK